MANYSSLPKVGDSTITTPVSSPMKRWTAVEKSHLSISHAVATSINSAKTTMGNKAKSIIPKIVQLTPVKKKNGKAVVDEDEASTPVIFYPDKENITMKQQSTFKTMFVDPFSAMISVFDHFLFLAWLGW